MVKTKKHRKKQKRTRRVGGKGAGGGHFSAPSPWDDKKLQEWLDSRKSLSKAAIIKKREEQNKSGYKREQYINVNPGQLKYDPHQLNYDPHQFPDRRKCRMETTRVGGKKSKKNFKQGILKRLFTGLPWGGKKHRFTSKRKN